MRPRIVALPGNDALAATLTRDLDADPGRVTVRLFPDGESYVRIHDDVAGRTVVLVCTLDRPNERSLPLLLMAAAARDLGAHQVGLVAPYLAYLRQDRRFRPGEGVTSSYFARILSDAVDWLVTVDPHLHRHPSLDALYPIPARALHAASLVAHWLRRHVPDAVLVGPDVESAQWVTAIGDRAGVPAVVLRKIRRGDHDVEVTLPADAPVRDRTPVLMDDIVSTGRTMLATIAELRRVGARPPVCLAVHAVFAGDAHARLRDAGAAQVVTCNTIVHESNGIDVGGLIADGVREMLVGPARRDSHS